jgi:hypothetical protein
MAARKDWNVTYNADEDRGAISYDNGGGGYFNVSLQFQHGPIGDNGVNGIQNEEVIDLLIQRIRALDERIPCVENVEALVGLETAAEWLKRRTQRRQEQGVEGQNIAHTS